MTGTDTATPPRGGTHGRPVVGAAIGVIGVAHLLAAPLVVGDSVRSILDGGVVASVDADPALADLRGVGFWYVVTGIACVMLAALVVWIERKVGAVPTFVGWMFVALAGFGIVLMPLSPFWAFLVVAALAFRSARRHGTLLHELCRDDRI